jgi:hypothetical protein
VGEDHRETAEQAHHPNDQQRRAVVDQRVNDETHRSCLDERRQRHEEEKQPGEARETASVAVSSGSSKITLSSFRPGSDVIGGYPDGTRTYTLGFGIPPSLQAHQRR